MHYVERAGRAGWEVHWRQCGLRAALRGLLPDLADLPEADRLEFEGIASMCGIPLGTSCYCGAYRDGVVRGQPGVPGVAEEVLRVKHVATGERRARRGRKGTEEKATQMELGLDV